LEPVVCVCPENRTQIFADPWHKVLAVLCQGHLHMSPQVQVMSAIPTPSAQCSPAPLDCAVLLWTVQSRLDCGTLGRRTWLSGSWMMVPSPLMLSVWQAHNLYITLAHMSQPGASLLVRQTLHRSNLRHCHSERREESGAVRRARFLVPSTALRAGSARNDGGGSLWRSGLVIPNAVRNLVRCAG
jgi:hypothetical protein